MNEVQKKIQDVSKDENTVQKVQYETPKIECLGKLSTLIQGVSGNRRDAFPMPGARMS